MKIFFLSCNISFDPLLRKSSSRSLKCIERNWPMYSLLKFTLVQGCKCIQGVLDNCAWIRILPSRVHDIFYTFKEIIQFKQINSYPKLDMYHPFNFKILIENLHQIQFFKQEHRKQRFAAPTLSSSENQFNFGHCNTKISYYKKYFLKRELNSASGKKKKRHEEKAYMESKTVMLVNSVLMKTLIL